jgi:hypothetical protein
VVLKWERCKKEYEFDQRILYTYMEISQRKSLYTVYTVIFEKNKIEKIFLSYGAKYTHSRDTLRKPFEHQLKY